MITESSLLSSAPSELAAVTAKVLNNKRLSLDDGLFLFSSGFGDYINLLASYARQKKVGNTVSYSVTLHLYPSNICSLECPICCFYAKEEDPSAFARSVDYLCNQVSEHIPYGITQVHIVSGLYRKLNVEYYKDLFTNILKISPGIEIKALSAVEYDYLSAISSRPVHEILQEMQSFGLSFLPGGGAEIFDEEIRKQIAPKKISAARYLQIHKIAHELGIRSNCTMLYNHVEEPINILHHLDKIRTLQDNTHGFSSFVPLRYHPLNNHFGTTQPLTSTTLQDRLYPVCRLMLDNIDHLCANWNYEGLERSQKALSAGASNIGNVVYGEQVATRSREPISQINEKTMEECIRAAHRHAKKQGRHQE
jgi:aminodeoxyfutalosine synthase